MQRSREFYENLLNQKVKYDFGENITFHGDFAIHLKSHYERLIDNKPVISGGNNFELYFECDNIEEMVTNLIIHNVQFVHELREQPWRQKVVRLYDPDMNIIEIGESLEHLVSRLSKDGMDEDSISKITGLPDEFIQNVLKA